nr:spore coat protein SP96 isoform X2 [Drosophila virilis]
MIRLWAIVAILALGCAVAQEADEPKCGVCQSGNDALCVTETSYYNCFGGNKYGNEIECDEGFVCTNADSICVKKTELEELPDLVNVCGSGSSGCGVCSTNQKYTCVSKNQAGRCINGKISAVVNCEDDEICMADIGLTDLSVCVPQCAADFLKKSPTCSEDVVYTTTTAAPAPTISPADRVAICARESSGVTTLFFYAYADTTCKSAVYCQRNSLTSADWVTLTRTCPSSTPYFDIYKRNCVATKPTSCPIPSTVPPVTTAIPDTTTDSTAVPADTTAGETGTTAVTTGTTADSTQTTAVPTESTAVTTGTTAGETVTTDVTSDITAGETGTTAVTTGTTADSTQTTADPTESTAVTTGTTAGETVTTDVTSDITAGETGTTAVTTATTAGETVTTDVSTVTTAGETVTTDVTSDITAGETVTTANPSGETNTPT